MMTYTISSALYRARNGILIGIGISVLMIVVAGLIDLASHGRAVQNVGLSFGQLVIIYIVGGIAGGAIFGVGEPFAKRSPIFAFPIGMLSIFPFAAAFAVCSFARPDWSHRGLIVAAIGSVVLGGPIGLIIGGWIQSD